jgi:D-amino-acid oxidase
MPATNLQLAPLPPILTDPARLLKTTVCTRPFRALGPRIEAESIGSKLVVHNYGHGGSGWSLSWGSATEALALALAGRDPALTDLAVIGCGALGLTSAILAQRAGCRSVTIYARDLPAHTRSFNATGSWTPFSRIALTRAVTPAFGSQWESITRTSWRHYQALLTHPDAPIRPNPRFYLSNLTPDAAEQQKIDADPIGFVDFRNRIADLYPAPVDFAPGQHPFPYQWARQRPELMFDITALSRQLTEEFLTHGGILIQREFHSPADFASLPQPVIIHSTGYAARALFADHSITPVRGQIAWLPPQPECNYGLFFDYLTILTRPDGIVVQFHPQGEATGWNDPSELPDPHETQTGLDLLTKLQSQISRL